MNRKISASAFAVGFAALLLLLSCTSQKDSREEAKIKDQAPAKLDAPRKPLDIVKAEEGPFDYQVMTMDNGMKVITLEDHSCPVAAVHVWYHVGSKNEDPHRRGFAHMFEHMMFRGTNRLGPEEHFDYIRRTGGSCNASTSFDQTVYVQEVPSNQVELAFWLESERMAFLRVDEEGFETERNVVAEEYRMGAEQPYGTIMDTVLPEVFRGGAYSWSVIGNMEELEASTVEDLQRFWETHYVPNNAALVVVGDIEHQAVQQLAMKYFGWIPRYPDPPDLAVPPSEPNETPLQISVKEKNGPAPILALGFRTVPVGHPDALPLEMLGAVLGGGESSRLYRRLVLEEESAMIALAGGFSLERDGIFGAAAVLNPVTSLSLFGGDKKKILGAIREEIEKIKTEGVTEKELTKARNNALRGAVTSQLTAASKARALGNAQVIEKDLAGVNGRFDRIRAVTAEDLLRVADAYLSADREIELEVKPSVVGFLLSQLGGKDGEAQPDGEASPEKGGKPPSGAPTGKPGLADLRPRDLGQTPPRAPLLAADLDQEIKEFAMENGLKVVVIPNHEVPFVTVTLGLKDGAFTDPEDGPGTAAMAAQMLTRGTASRTYEELAEALDTLAITISGSAEMDAASVSAGAVTDQAGQAVAYLAEVVMTPTFPEEQFRIMAKQVQTAKAIQEKSPEYAADRELRKRLFGSHPYARNPDGEAADLERITVKGMREWWEEHARPDRCVLYFAGDLKAHQAYQLAVKHFSLWAAEGPEPRVTLPPIPEPESTRIFLVNRPGAQAQLRVGQVGITRRHPRFFTTRVLNQIFGGGFNARLNKAIRVEKGLTYGARGGFYPGRFAGRFQASTFTKNASVGEAVQTILNEIRRLKDDPPTPEEMDMAQSYLVGSFVLSRETPQSVLSERWLMEYEDLPGDYFDRYLSGIKAATSAEVVEAASELVGEDTLVIVVVGQADQVQDQLEAIAPVTVVEGS